MWPIEWEHLGVPGVERYLEKDCHYLAAVVAAGVGLAGLMSGRRQHLLLEYSLATLHCSMVTEPVRDHALYSWLSTSKKLFALIRGGAQGYEEL